MPATPPRLSSPFAASGTPRTSGTPITPNSTYIGRNPHPSLIREGQDNSPTNTFSGSGNSLRLDTSTSGIRIMDLGAGTPRPRVMLRSDPSILTCFDPADKELYDLWAPKH